MNATFRLIAAVLMMGTRLLTGAQGPAGTGACSHVLGPVGPNGMPIEFTCEDMGGSALLVWNANQSSATITISGGIRAVSFFPTDFTLDGSITSNGPLALIGGGAGGGIFINGMVTAPNLIIAAIDASVDDVKSTLLGNPATRLTSTSSSLVYVGTTGIVDAKSGNLIVVGSLVINDGNISAQNGTANFITGSKLEVGWDGAAWLEGKTGVEDHQIDNTGVINAKDIRLEAQRVSTDSIRNVGKISATNSITLVTGTPGAASGNTYVPGTFGISNTGGQMFAASITVSPYYEGNGGGPPADRTFLMSDAAQRAQLETDLGGGQVFEPTQDNTPTGASAPVIDSTQTFTVTGNIVVPQLAPSLTNLNTPPVTQRNATPIAQANATSMAGLNATPMSGLNSTGFTHLNATSKGTTLASVNDGSEQLRGEGAQPRAVKPKARARAKPVLVRGAFFDSKISAVITSNR